MKPIYIVSGAVVILIIAAVVIATTRHNQKNGSMAAVGTQNEMAQPANTDNSNASMPASGSANQSVTPINSNVGSVAGVNLSSLSTDANANATDAANVGSATQQEVSGDGANINSSTDSVSNPLQ